MPGSIGNFLERVGRFVRRSEFDGLDSAEKEALARDIGVTSYDLERLAECGPEAAKFLYERLAAEGLDAREIERRHPEIMKDMQRTCSVCGDKRRCERDLENASDGWKSYCPNATTIDDLR
jgi:hypothetical protein